MVLPPDRLWGLYDFSLKGFLDKNLKNLDSCTLYVIFSFQSLCSFSIFYQISHFGAVVRYRLSSDLILNFNFNFSHEEFKNWLGSSLIIVIFPFLQLGQHKISWPVNRSIISRKVSFDFSGKAALGSINFRMRATACFLFLCDRNPKYRIFIKLCGSTWSKNLRINSLADIVIILVVLLSALSSCSKLTWPLSMDLIRLFDMATLWV